MRALRALCVKAIPYFVLADAALLHFARFLPHSGRVADTSHFANITYIATPLR